MKRTFVTMALAAMAVSSATAQVWTLRNKNFTVTGVSNEGVGVGYEDLGQPYKIWNPVTQEYREIGGISAGYGIGGSARWSADGRYICGSHMQDIMIGDSWMEYSSKVNFKVKSIAKSYDYKFYAVGEMNDDSRENKGVMVRSGNGQAWREMVYGEWNGESFAGDIPYSEKSINCVDFFTDQVGLVCGDGAYFAYTTSQGSGWLPMSPIPDGCTDEVADYTTMDLQTEYTYPGVVGARLADGSGAIYQTPDGAETWQTSTGVSGVPRSITHIGICYYMATENNHIQMSSDLGRTWKDVFVSDMNIYKVAFGEPMSGVAISDGVIFRSVDYGKTWTDMAVELGVTDDVKWNDIVWTDYHTCYIIGSGGACYKSESRGAVWEKVDVNTDADLTAFLQMPTYNVIADANGNFHRLATETQNLSVMGRYDVTRDRWEMLETLGYAIAPDACSAYNISSDGKHVVGLGHVLDKENNLIVGNACVWTEGEGTKALGNMFGVVNGTARMCRANAVNEDGSVIVGAQDHNGPWHGSVWRRNAEGEYIQSLIMKDPELGWDDLSNTTNDAHAVSPNGKWIGGNGNNGVQTCTDSPWIWSEETGLIQLTPGVSGCVTGITNDGVAVGYSGTGQSAFIYSEEMGCRDFNEYVKTELGFEAGNLYICSILDISDNGEYVAAWGIEPSPIDPNSVDVVGIIVKLADGTNGITTIKQNDKLEATVYPLIATQHTGINIDLPDGTENATINMVDMTGRMVKSLNTTSQKNTIQTTGITPGLYILDVQAGAQRKTCKVRVS